MLRKYACVLSALKHCARDLESKTRHCSVCCNRVYHRLVQMTLIGVRILVRTAKSTHTNLSHMCGVVPRRPPPVRVTDGPADNGAGPSSRNRELGEEALRYLIADEKDEGSWGGLPWDPLTPRLIHGAQLLVEEGRDRPLAAAVVVAAALPFSGVAACVAAPVLVGDATLQWGAKTPTGQAIGQGTLNAFEVKLN